MKKLFALILALAMALSLVACGSESTENAAQDTQESAAEATTEEGNPWDAAVGQTYIVGTDTTFAPFEFEDDNGEHTGIDIRLLDAIAEEMGFNVDWQVLGFSASVTALESYQVDAVMAGMSITDARKEKYDFSESYYDCAVAIAVAADSDYESIEDLTGKTVVAKTGTTGSQYAYEVAEEYGLTVLEVEESALMYTYVASGQAEACFEDYPIVQYEIQRGNVDCKVINTSDYSYPTGFATMKDAHPELVAAFNEGFARLVENGTYDAILADYFG